MIAQHVPADDRGLTLGVGLFETVLVVDGAPRLWGAHLDRLARGCAALGLPTPDRALCRVALDGAVAQAGLAQGRAAARLAWTGGSGARGLAAPASPAPRLLAAAALAPAPPQALRLGLATVRRNPSSPTSRFKTLSYLDNVVARAEAAAAGADEALMLDGAGRLACAAAANLFWLEGDRLLTPSPACGALPGVVRGAALALAARFGLKAAEVEAAPDRLLRAEAAFLTSSLIGAVAATSLDGAALPPPPDRLQPLLSALSDL